MAADSATPLSSAPTSPVLLTYFLTRLLSHSLTASPRVHFTPRAHVLTHSGADLGGADLIATDLAHADLDGAHLVGVQAHGADMSSANLVGATLAGAIAYLTHPPTHTQPAHGPIYLLFTVQTRDS